MMIDALASKPVESITITVTAIDGSQERQTFRGDSLINHTTSISKEVHEGDTRPGFKTTETTVVFKVTEYVPIR
jgi:hypothetical protein